MAFLGFRVFVCVCVFIPGFAVLPQLSRRRRKEHVRFQEQEEEEKEREENKNNTTTVFPSQRYLGCERKSKKINWFVIPSCLLAGETAAVAASIIKS